MFLSDRSKCSSCSIWHLETCTAIEKGPGADLGCKVCPDSDDSDGDGGRATKRRRKGDKQTLPEDENLAVDTSM